MFKQEIIELLVEETKLHVDEVERLLETPPRLEMGDYSFPCFSFANPNKDDEMWANVEKGFFKRKNPVDIAKHFKDQLNDKKLPKEIEKIEAKGPYVNFFVNKKLLAQKILKINSNYGKGKNKGKILVEYASPNSSKPLHLGHLMNISLGESISRIFEFQGKKVSRVNLNNDRGMPISKTMIVYKKFYKNKTPESEKIKSDHFVGDLYVLYGKKENPKLEEETRELLRLQESGNKEVIKLWKKIVDWVLKGHKETYKIFGATFDKEYYESKILERAKEIVQEGLDKGIFEKNKEGAIAIQMGIINGEDLGEKILLRPDGTAVYIVQDLELAKQKKHDFNPDLSINVVGNEHNYHFKVLYEILKKLGHKERHYHLSYGLISLPEGRMKSREGTVVDADNIIKEIKDLAKNSIKSKLNKKISDKELEKRSLIIALGALKYTLLKIEAKKNFMFDPKESISFEGNTGPYLQYSYARASSIIRKAKTKSSVKIPELSKEEISLLKNISKFSETIDKSATLMNPALIANYSYELAKSFNEFYHSCQVIGDKNEAFRLKLIDAFRTTLKNSLYLLGIEVMEEM